MNDEAFKIYVEQLRDGHVHKIKEIHAPDFLDVHEDELRFEKPVDVEGEAYLADDKLILHLNISTHAIIPCSICNGPVDVEIQLPNFYHMEEPENIKSGIFDFGEVLREAILLEVPAFGECHQGNCPERAQVAHYLKTPTKSGSGVDSDEEEGYHPFADVDFDKFEPKT